MKQFEFKNNKWIGFFQCGFNAMSQTSSSGTAILSAVLTTYAKTNFNEHNF